MRWRLHGFTIAQLFSEDQCSRRSVENQDANKSIRSKLLVSIGAHGFSSPEAALTELIATAWLLFTLTTSIVACLDSHETDPKLLVPFAVFVIVFLFLLLTVPLTGGHMSPVFTCIAALKGGLMIGMGCVVVAAAMAGAVFVYYYDWAAWVCGVGLKAARYLGPELLKGGPLWNGPGIFWIGPFLACMLYYGVSINLPT